MPTEKTAHHHAAQELGASALGPVQRFAAMTAHEELLYLLMPRLYPRMESGFLREGLRHWDFGKVLQVIFICSQG